jgi:hypothetical protein
MDWRFVMAYERVVLSDGTEVLFAISENPEAADTNDADTSQRDPMSLSALPPRGACEPSLAQ